MLHTNLLAEVLGEESWPGHELPGLESKSQPCRGLPVPNMLLWWPHPAPLFHRTLLLWAHSTAGPVLIQELVLLPLYTKQ